MIVINTYRIIFSINWDTDGHTTEELGLPDEIVVETYSEKDAEAIANADLSESLSDEYGFCINSIKSKIEK